MTGIIKAMPDCTNESDAVIAVPTENPAEYKICYSMHEHLGRGLEYHIQGNLDAALAEYQAALELMPKDPHGLCISHVTLQNAVKRERTRRPSVSAIVTRRKAAVAHRAARAVRRHVEGA